VGREARCGVERGGKLGLGFDGRSTRIRMAPWQRMWDGRWRAVTGATTVWPGACTQTDRGTRSWPIVGHWQAGPANLNFSLNFKISINLKFKTKVFRMSNNIQTLYGNRFEYFEQLYKLGRLQIPNIIHVIMFGINSNLNFP
jgi:hypothetical protein